MNITELSIKRPTLIVVIFAALTVFGIFSYKQLNYELLPNFSMPTITIMTIYPGASPSDVENSVTKKIEDVVSTTENIDDIRSFSQENVSYVIMEFKPSVNVDDIIQDVQRKINSIQSQLPKDVETPTITKFGMSDFPIMNIGVSSQMNQTELFDIVKHRISPELNGVKGVGEIILAGGEEREIAVNVKADKLEKYSLSLLQITQAIITANPDYPTGKIKNSSQQMQIRLSGKYKNIEDLRNLVITKNGGNSPVQLKDVAEVHDTYKEKKNYSSYH